MSCVNVSKVYIAMDLEFERNNDLKKELLRLHNHGVWYDKE